jgi:type VI secretion system protein ImpJ
MTQTPQLVKVALRPSFANLSIAPLPGMPLLTCPIPPPAISTRVETQYFGISRTGPCWSPHASDTRHVGVYVPSEFPNPNYRLLVVLDN